MLRLLENRILRETLLSKREEQTKGWRKLHNKDM